MLVVKANSDNCKDYWRYRSRERLPIFSRVKLVEEYSSGDCFGAFHGAFCTKSFPSGHVERPATTLAPGCLREPLALFRELELDVNCARSFPRFRRTADRRASPAQWSWRKTAIKERQPGSNFCPTVMPRRHHPSRCLDSCRAPLRAEWIWVRTRGPTSRIRCKKTRGCPRGCADRESQRSKISELSEDEARLRSS